MSETYSIVYRVDRHTSCNKVFPNYKILYIFEKILDYNLLQIRQFKIICGPHICLENCWTLFTTVASPQICKEGRTKGYDFFKAMTVWITDGPFLCHLSGAVELAEK